MVTAEKRTLQIEARLKDFLSRDLNRAEKALVRFGVYGTAGLKKIIGATFNLKTALAGLVAGFGALQGIQTVRKFGEEADALLKLSVATGDLVENLSELDAVLKLGAGNDLDLTTALRALLTVERKAIDGTDDARQAFAALGITLEDLERLGPSALFERIAEGLGRFSNEQERALALARLLPKQFLALLPVLGGGLEKFQSAIREARDSGATVSKAQALTSERLNDAFTKIEIALGGVSRALIEAFGPKAITLLEGLSRKITENKDGIVSVAEAIGRGIVTAVSLAIDAIIGLIGFVESIPGVDLIDSARLQKEIADAKKQLADLDEARDPGAARRRAAERARSLIGSPLGNTTNSPGNFGLGAGFNAAAMAQQTEFEAWERRIKQEADALVAALGPQEQALRERIATLESTLRDGISGALARTKDQLSSQLASAVAQVRSETGQSVADAVAPPTEDQAWAQYAENFGKAMQKIKDDAAATQQATQSVFRPTANAGTGFEAPDANPENERDRLQLAQQVLSLAQDLEPVQRALRDIEQQQFVLALQEAKDKGTINAQELAVALDIVNAQFARARSLVGGGNFFDGFNKGARSALRSWTDFTKAGEEAASTLVDGGLNGLTDAFADIITGTKSAKEAFKDFARQMLSDLARIISKLVIMQAVNAVLGYEDGGVLPAAMEKGGIVPMATGGAINRNGGIARRPTVLFGEGKNAEAYVPLPDNRSIPVSFVGNGPSGGGQNLQINITAMDSRDVQRVLLEQQGTLRTIFTNQAETKNTMRQVIRRAGI